MKILLSKTILYAGLSVLMLLPAITLASGPVQHSAFIGGKVQLEKCPKRHGSYCYFKPGMDLSRFDRVAFAPIEYMIHMHSEYTGMNPEDFKLVSDTFIATLTDQLEPKFPVINKMNGQTLFVRIALIDIKMERKSRGLLGYTPIGLAVGATQDRVSKKLKLLDAVIEAELIDAGTGERLAVLVDQNLYEDGSNAESWQSMELIFKHYGRRLRARLEGSLK